MSQLIMSAIPGFTDLPDASLAANQPLTDYSLTKISNNAKFAAVRDEVFYGWYANGNTVLLPTSLVDGYTYARTELEYEIVAFFTRAPTGLTPGQAAKPARANVNGAAGTFYLQDYNVEGRLDASPGLVVLETHYWDGTSEHVTNDGCVRVRTTARRLSDNEG